MLKKVGGTVARMVPSSYLYNIKSNNMKQTIGYILLLLWCALFILVLGEPTGTETNNPTWVGWAFCFFFLAGPFISLNLIMPKNK